MELKFYLRGLGLGIVVTALIMGMTSSKNQTMTDAQIIARAKQLGMIEDTVLKDNNTEENNDSEEHNDSEENNDSKETSSGSENNLQEETPESDRNMQSEAEVNRADKEKDTDTEDVLADADVEDTETNRDEEGMGTLESDTGTEDTEDVSAETDSNASGAPAVITIGNGDGSYSASKKLAAAGLVSSAESFDNFLCENGYDKKIRAGTYTIPIDASDEQMARIITGAE